MNELLKPDSNGYSGIKTLHFAYREDVDYITITMVDSLELPESNIVFKTGKDWNRLYFTPQTIAYDEKERETKGGKVIDFSIKYNYPGDEVAVTTLLESMRTRNYLLKLKDMNNNILLFGSLETPFNMNYRKVKGNNPSGAKHYEIEFFGTSLKSAIYLT